MSDLAENDRVPFELKEIARGLLLPLLALLMVGAMLTAMTHGAANLTVGDIFGIFGRLLTAAPIDDQVAYAIIVEIRLPRILLGAAVGATLAVAGAVLQALFRNPLAEPSIIGVSAGAGAAAVATIVLGTTFGALGSLILYALPVAAFVGGFVATMLVVAIARVGGKTPMTTILLSGVGLGFDGAHDVHEFRRAASVDHLLDVGKSGWGDMGGHCPCFADHVHGSSAHAPADPSAQPDAVGGAGSLLTGAECRSV